MNYEILETIAAPNEPDHEYILVQFTGEDEPRKLVVPMALDEQQLALTDYIAAPENQPEEV